MQRCDNYHINTNDNKINDALVNQWVHLTASAAPNISISASNPDSLHHVKPQRSDTQPSALSQMEVARRLNTGCSRKCSKGTTSSSAQWRTCPTQWLCSSRCPCLNWSKWWGNSFYNVLDRDDCVCVCKWLVSVLSSVYDDVLVGRALHQLFNDFPINWSYWKDIMVV